MQATSSRDDESTSVLCTLDGIEDHGARVCTVLAFDDITTDATTPHLELGDGSRTKRVACRKEQGLALRSIDSPAFPMVVVFPTPFTLDDEDHRRRPCQGESHCRSRLRVMRASRGSRPSFLSRGELAAAQWRNASSRAA